MLLTSCFIGTILTVAVTIAFLIGTVALAVQTLCQAHGDVAVLFTARYHHVTEHDQSGVLKGTISIDTEGGRGEVHQLVGVAFV